jgi:hypothetical protein
VAVDCATTRANLATLQHLGKIVGVRLDHRIEHRWQRRRLGSVGCGSRGRRGCSGGRARGARRFRLSRTGAQHSEHDKDTED